MEVDGLGCMIYRWKALLNPYTAMVKACWGTQEYPGNEPNNVATFCENEIHHISTNTARITLLEYALESYNMYLSNGTKTANIGAGEPLVQP